MVKTCQMCAGDQRSEAECLFEHAKNSLCLVPGKKSRFKYKIGPVQVCRRVFFLTLGLSPKNSRMAKFERMIRSGVKFLPPADKKPHMNKKLVHKTEIVAAYLRRYVLAHSEKSPCLTKLLVEAPCNREFYAEYKTCFDPEEQLCRRSFFNVWYKVMSEPIVDPIKNKLFQVQFRKRQAVGFTQCDECQRLGLLVKVAKTIAEKQIAEGNQIAHRRSVRRDREEVQRIKLQCRGNEKLVGFSIDVVDTHKWPTPTTKSQAKVGNSS